MGSRREPGRPWWQLTRSPWASLLVGVGFLVSGSLGFFATPVRTVSFIWFLLGVTYLASCLATFRSGQAVRPRYPVRWRPFWPPDED